LAGKVKHHPLSNERSHLHNLNQVVKSLKGKEIEMKLWVTPKGDRWLCDECQPEFEEQIRSEKWRVAFDELDQMLRCSHCKHSDVEIPD
jgi:hypothetical protein